jgi:hypothetical protein
MGAVEFAQARRRMMARTLRGTGGNVTGMEADILHGIDLSAVLSLVDIKRTGDADHMIRVRCRPKALGIPSKVLSADLERLWMEWPRYQDGFEAHRLVVSGEQVVLEGITLPLNRAYFITVQVVVASPS